MVAGAGVAGLRYRNTMLWDDHGHPDHVATSGDSTPTFETVTLTSADEVLDQPDASEATAEAPAAADAGAPPPAPKPRAKPVATKREPKHDTKADSKPETKSTDDDVFAKPE